MEVIDRVMQIFQGFMFDNYISIFRKDVEEQSYSSI